MTNDAVLFQNPVGTAKRFRTTLDGAMSTLHAPSAAAHVVQEDGEFRVVASHTVRAGEVVLHINGAEQEYPNRYSIQVGADRHVEADDTYELDELLQKFRWRFLNHSCESNSAVRGREVVALRHIEAGEEVTFNYNTTEYEMASPFECRCGSESCIGEIRGFKHISEAERERLRPLLSSHLRSLLEQEAVAEPL